MAEEKTVNLKVVKIKSVVETGKRKLKAGAKKAWEWTKNNKEYALAGGVVVLRMTRSVMKAYAAHKESERRDCSFYDPRKGRYTTTKRKPTSREAAEIERRYDAGESYAHILDDMRLAK